MKKLFFTLTGFLVSILGIAQNNLVAPTGLYGPAYFSTSTISSGGSLLVGLGGNYAFGGVLSTGTTPTSTNIITFQGTGTTSAASATNGFINGFGSVINPTASFMLPLGQTSTYGPLTFAVAATGTMAARFDVGPPQNNTVDGTLRSVNDQSYFETSTGDITSGQLSFVQPPNAYGLAATVGAAGFNGTSWTLIGNTSPYNAGGPISSTSISLAAYSQIALGSVSNYTLPVLLTSFTGSNAGCTANLAWQTSSESGSSYYAVEYASNGYGFAQVGKVASKNSPSGAAYAFSYSMSNANTGYFRLRMVDFDGSSAYSQVVTVMGSGACATGLQVRVVPNPIVDKILHIQGLVVGTRLLLTTTSGQKLLQVTATGTTQHINMASYAKGAYLLYVETPDGNTETLKVMIQ